MTSFYEEQKAKEYLEFVQYLRRAPIAGAKFAVLEAVRRDPQTIADACARIDRILEEHLKKAPANWTAEDRQQFKAKWMTQERINAFVEEDIKLISESTIRECAMNWLRKAWDYDRKDLTQFHENIDMAIWVCWTRLCEQGGKMPVQVKQIEKRIERQIDQQLTLRGK